MISYPVHFQGKSQASSGILGGWSTMASEVETLCSIPTSFEGSGEGLSPEDHYLLAVQNCFVATFKVFAHHSRLEFSDLDVSSSLTVDKDSSGKPWMARVELEISLDGATDTKKARLLLQKTLENGFILRSIKSQLDVRFVLNGEILTV